jgi:serine/threonine-protein kinase
MFEFGAFRYDPESRLLYRDDEEIVLQPRVAAVLESFLKRPGKVVAKESVLASVWDNAFVGETSLAQAISSLRRQLGDDPRDPRYIETLPRRGYRLIPEVVRTGEREQSPAPMATTLSSGMIVGRYELLDPLDAGSMGAVWRAQDRELQRIVALKAVSGHLTDNEEVSRRFHREARVLAHLEHPNVVTVYGVEEVDGRRFLAMELVAGQTLAQRLERGAMPLSEALAIAVQIAAALEAAHARGVIHRDLKPSNVLLDQRGVVKLVDFGLSGSVGPAGAVSNEDPSAASDHTALLGTPAYMSPEQARREGVDQRADIWAFGCVTYEMLSGQAIFSRGTVAETLEAVVGEDPDWSLLPATTPPGVRRTLSRCLQKAPHQRLHHIADARVEIEEALQGADGPVVDRQPSAPLLSRRNVLTGSAVIAAFALGAAAVAVIERLRDGGELDPRVAGPVAEGFALIHELPDGQWVEGRYPGIAVSPDGTRIVYSVTDGERRWLALRTVGESEASPIPGTDGGIRPFFEGGTKPFFSPDGASVAFFTTTGGLFKVRLEGGPPQPVWNTRLRGDPGLTGTWGDDGIIVLGGVGQRLVALPAAGGEPDPITELRKETGERVHMYPHVLPGSNKVLFAVDDVNGTHLEVLDRETGARKLLLPNVGRAWYVSAGYLVYAQQRRLMAVAFDADALEIRDQPFAIATGVANHWLYLGSSADVGRGGAIAYVPYEDALPQRRLVLRTRDGGEVELTAERRGWAAARFAPAGDDLLALLTDELHDMRMWITAADPFSLASIDLPAPPAQAPNRRGGTMAAVEEPVAAERPYGVRSVVWHPSGERLTVFGMGSAGYGVYSVPIDRSAAPELLFEPPGLDVYFPTSWSADGRYLVLNRYREGVGWDIWVFDAEEESVTPFGTDQAEPDRRSAGGSLSPHGDWIAYQRSGLWVEPFPDGGQPHAVVPRGPRPFPYALWSAQGDEIFYVQGDQLMSVPVHTEPKLGFGEPTEVFSGPYRYHLLGGINAYDVSPDGKSFILIERGSGQSVSGEPLPNRIMYRWDPSWQRGGG